MSASSRIGASSSRSRSIASCRCPHRVHPPGRGVALHEHRLARLDEDDLDLVPRREQLAVHVAPVPQVLHLTRVQAHRDRAIGVSLPHELDEARHQGHRQVVDAIDSGILERPQHRGFSAPRQSRNDDQLHGCSYSTSVTPTIWLDDIGTTSGTPADSIPALMRALTFSWNSRAESCPPVLEQLVAGDDLDEGGDVATRAQRDAHQGDVHRQHRPHVRLGAEAIEVGALHLGQLDDDLDLLVVTHGGDPEQVRDVQDAHPADFHVVLMQHGRGAPHGVGRSHHDLDDVVRDQTMALEHQVQRGLGLAHTAAPDQQQPHPEHVDEHAVDRRGGRQRILEAPGDARDEGRTHQRRAEDRDAVDLRNLHQTVRRLEPPRDGDGADPPAHVRAQILQRLHLRDRQQVVDLGEAEDLDAVAVDVLGEARQGQPGLLDPRARDAVVQAAPAR